MRAVWLAGIIAGMLVTAAWAAEKLEDKSIHLSMDAPEAFIKSPELPKADAFIGTAKGLFLSPQVADNGAALLVHHMELPAGADYATFKGIIAAQLGQVFGAGFKLVKQEDVTADKFSGFLLEFTCAGDGTKPDPNGTIPHHIRWHFLKDGDAKLIGVLYGARDANWNEMEPKYATSFKTLKRVE
jgi:hypothetical protein